MTFRNQNSSENAWWSVQTKRREREFLCQDELSARRRDVEMGQVVRRENLCSHWLKGKSYQIVSIEVSGVIPNVTYVLHH